MQATLYANAEDISSQSYDNPSLRPENRLHLLPEHIAQISTAFIQQLSFATLKSRETRILSALYYQTIGHNKREDDMNGACLELLTGIRSDHANEAIRRLDALNIVMTRKGSYGKWMSINFDFKNWGKEVPETRTNNPNLLLSTTYQTLLPTEEAEGSVFSLYAPPMSQLAKKELIPTPDKPTEPTEPTESSKAVVLASSTEPFSINYPTSLPKKLCQQLAKYLKEIGVQKQAQRLVEYFANQLQKGNIRNPIAYFINLKNRLLKGKLGLSETQSSASTTHDVQKTNSVLPTLRAEYQDATADYEQLKTTIERISSSENCSFDEASELINYTPIWRTAVERIVTISKELKAYQQKNPKTSQTTAPQQPQVKTKTTQRMPQHIGDILKGLEALPS